jgi:hypothetical protein
MKSDKIKLVETPFGVQVIPDMTEEEEFDNEIAEFQDLGYSFNEGIEAIDFNDECGDR